MKNLSELNKQKKKKNYKISTKNGLIFCLLVDDDVLCVCLHRFIKYVFA